MNIRELIKDLLLKHNIVVLPGIGGFISEYEEAKVDPKENKLSPPKKNIRFDTKLIKDETSLIENHLIKTFNISQNEASTKTKNFIEDLKKDLSYGTVVEFKNIGYLKSNDKQEIIFEPKLEKNLLLDSFGFETITQKSYDKPPVPPKPKTSAPKINIKEQKKGFVLKPYIILPAIAIIIVVLLVVFTDLEKTILNIDAKELFAKRGKNKIEPVIIKDQTELGKSLDEQTEPSVALQIEDENKAEIDDKYANCTEFIIIAGSFTQSKNAEELRQRLIKKGYDPKIILSEENRYRVALKSFDDRLIALKEFEKLKAKEKDLNMWLLSI